MSGIRKWHVFAFFLLWIVTITPLQASKKASFATASVTQGDPPPGNAMAFSVPRARATLKKAMGKKYVGAMSYHLLFSTFSGELAATTDFHLRANGFDLVAPFTWMGRGNEGKYSVNYKETKHYLQQYSFKFGQTLYSVGFLPDPRRTILGWGGLSGTVPVQFVWTEEGDAEEFADAFNRLLYAAYRNEESQDSETFSAAAKAWRENPAKPPLSPEADRHRILAENAVNERRLDAAVEHYESALEVQPMWPAGWFNLALIYAEQNDYADATDRMQHYLELVPDAADAKEAHEQMIIWEDKAKR